MRCKREWTKVTTMTDRERLIDLMIEAKRTEPETGSFTDYLADYLLEHGVIVLPCNVGDTVWYITGMGHNLIKPAKIKEIIIGKDGIKDLYVQGDGCNFENSFDIFYTTEEEAQRALKGDNKEAKDNG